MANVFGLWSSLMEMARIGPSPNGGSRRLALSEEDLAGSQQLLDWAALLGGRFDGVLSVLAGLEIFRTLNDQGITTQRPLVLVNWTNEEGSRFAPAMGGSGVYSERLSLEDFRAAEDRMVSLWAKRSTNPATKAL